jgi:hypothetical protein
MLIVQGDNGITLPFKVVKDKILDLTGATVKVDIKRGEDILSKTAEILDAIQGICQITLLSSDLIIAGTYKYQWTVTYEDGRTLSGKPTDISVTEKLTGSTPSTGNGDITVIVDGGDLG